MRIEQLVLYGPGDDDRVRFGPGVTVFAGLGPRERTDLIETVVDALTGRLSNASVVYTDHEGRRVFADRTGATYATTGSPAPLPRELLGADPATVSALLTLTATDLGLGERVSAADLGVELAAARTDLERLQAEHADVTERAGLVTTWQAELAELSRRIARADEDAARWAWVKLRRHLDEVRAELNMLDSDDRGRSDRRVLQAVDALRIAGQTWADLAAAAAALRAELGDLPAVSSDDLARVAATPAELPAGFDARMEYLQAATDLRWAADAELAEVPQGPPEADDEMVGAFAAIDQERLWAAHRRIEE
ncbi:MAG TPA: hypothetical protein VHK88_19295, partial [Aquihabitans sp.]|nr:hypothetical protein [Aquihabitans sp.]